jgi:hypothetical protein
MPVNVALWEPDIRPPLAWLVPSVLYQEKISTLAPHADPMDRDGREAYDLKQQLGELYEPLSLSLLDSEAYAKLSLKKYRPMAARNEDKKVFSGLL